MDVHAQARQNKHRREQMESAPPQGHCAANPAAGARPCVGGCLSGCLAGWLRAPGAGWLGGGLLLHVRFSKFSDISRLLEFG